MKNDFLGTDNFVNQCSYASNHVRIRKLFSQILKENQNKVLVFLKTMDSVMNIYFCFLSYTLCCHLGLQEEPDD